MKTKRQELIDFSEFALEETDGEVRISEMLIDKFLKSINYELSEPEADGCNKQSKEFCVRNLTPEICEYKHCHTCSFYKHQNR